MKPAGAEAEPLRENSAPVTIANVGEWLKGRAMETPTAVRRYVQAKPVGSRYRIEKNFENTGTMTLPASWHQVDDNDRGE